MLSLDSEEDSEESEPKEKKQVDSKPNSDIDDHPVNDENQDHTAHQETVGKVEQSTSKEEKVNIPKETPQENEQRKEGGKKMDTRQHELPEVLTGMIYIPSD
eukprot:Seg1270.8 transcript_id=Seg1270.8/GoldUCD/mRNA.D3Y31 product="hypothetical protein" protein_id=Seg1270.8/GoldUCD/D3Y31